MCFKNMWKKKDRKEKKTKHGVSIKACSSLNNGPKNHQFLDYVNVILFKKRKVFEDEINKDFEMRRLFYKIWP